MKRPTLAVLVSVAFLTACINHLWADLPPLPFDNPDPALASEDIDIKVLSVHKRQIDSNDIKIRWDLTIIAEVRTVRKSVTQLKKGDRITFCYLAHEYRKRGWTGPASPQMILRKGETYSAALDYMALEKDGYYYPGGGRYGTFGSPGKKK
jgi:hypothetical protein